MESAGIPRKLVRSPLAGLLIVLTVLARGGPAQEQGELQLRGEHIARLVLVGDDGRTRKWTNPPGSVDLLVGTYRVRELTLTGDFSVQTPTALGEIVIRETAPAVLTAGGPLRQTIDARRQGRMLILGYHLKGIGDEIYAAPGRPEQRGRFTVYRGPKVIGRGAFEYG